MRADLDRLKRDSESGKNVAVISGPITAAPSVSASGAEAAAIAAGKKKKAGLLAAICALLVAAALGAVGFYFHWHKDRKLTDKDTVVLADFANSTGDAVFDDTLMTIPFCTMLCMGLRSLLLTPRQWPHNCSGLQASRLMRTTGWRSTPIPQRMRGACMRRKR
jgi:hypothetical protein